MNELVYKVIRTLLFDPDYRWCSEFVHFISFNICDIVILEVVPRVGELFFEKQAKIFVSLRNDRFMFPCSLYMYSTGNFLVKFHTIKWCHKHYMVLMDKKAMASHE